jgi:hypothetical protein
MEDDKERILSSPPPSNTTEEPEREGNGEGEPDFSRILASSRARPRRKQARVYRPPRPIIRGPLNKFACSNCQRKKTKVPPAPAPWTPWTWKYRNQANLTRI